MEATVGFVVWKSGNVTYAFADKIPTLPVVDWVGGNLIVRGVVYAIDTVYNLEDRWLAAEIQEIQALLKEALEPVRVTDRLAVRRQARRSGAEYLQSIGDDVVLLPTPTLPAYRSKGSLFGNEQGTILTAQAIVGSTCTLQVEPIHLELLSMQDFHHCVENDLPLPDRRRQASRREADMEFLKALGLKAEAEPDF